MNYKSCHFSRKMRLLIPKEYRRVFEKNNYFYFKCATVLVRVNDLMHPRLGVIVSKKNVKLSTDRNKTKRIIREQFRLHQHILPNVDIVFIMKKNAYSFIVSKQISEKLLRLWQKISLQLKEY